MTIRSLGYVVVESTDPAKWRRFAVEHIGLMEAAAGPDGSLRFRIDERPFRIAVVAGSKDRLLGCGWELRDAASLEASVTRLREAGVEVREATAAQRESRAVQRLYFCSDPCGNLLELYHGRALDYAPFASPRGLSGFVAGELGMGHAVLPAPDLHAAHAFYQRLGFADSDEMWLAMSPRPNDPKLGIYFMHVSNRRHHSLALVGAPAPPSACIHIMLEARTLDDVGYALDRCLAGGAHISSTLGRHSNDLMVSFYVQTPGGFDLEFGYDGLQPDWSTWVPTHSLIPDLWGHRWAPPPS